VRLMRGSAGGRGWSWASDERVWPWYESSLRALQDHGLLAAPDAQGLQ
jgi:hypothetical protein